MSAEPNPSTPSSSSNEAADFDTQLLEEITRLKKEREELMAMADRLQAPEFEDFSATVSKRLRVISDLRDYQLANLDAAYRVECQQAWNDFEIGKKRLRDDMLKLSVERRRRIDQLRSGVSKKKKRRGPSDRAPKRARPEPGPSFVSSLESQGLVKLTATPDEVNQDIMRILNAADSARANGTQRPPIDRAQDVTSRDPGDKIHISRGILHYQGLTYEKGDRLRVCGPSSNGKKGKERYRGVVLSVNSKELQIKDENDGSLHRVFIANVRSGRTVIKPIKDVTTEQTSS